MRASEIRAAIVAIVEAITLPAAENPPGTRGKFRARKAGRKEILSAQDREFAVRLQVAPAPTRGQLPTDSYRVVYQVQVYYSDKIDVDDVMADDGERVCVALEQLSGAHADIHRTLPPSPGIPSL